MELRHIRYFLAVAEEKNFTRAAARVGIAQPPLSQQIKDLEREVGSALFYRMPHGAEMTAAGKAFLEQVHNLPSQAEQALEAARRAARGETGTLNLGITGASALNPIVSRLIRTFRRDFPDVMFRVKESHSTQLREDLEKGDLDVAILRPSDQDPPSITTHQLDSEALIAAMSRSRDPAPDAEAIDLLLLKDTPLILTPPIVGLILHDSAILACQKAGFEPIIGQAAPQIASIMSMVAADLGFSLVPDCMRQLALEDIVYKRLHHPNIQVNIACAILRDNRSPTAQAFTKLARRLRAGHLAWAQDQNPVSS
ncbi:LysR family transcriptional regulator [Cohaesibacter intestini]|uniref:LysR family transcriptional regulator n=1 Tax=Cohaesibacter intestini TaxID=2211145 RepID=UPI000DEBE4EC|nr:LysR family transcriptional regulator [Cohaesibacter intestini]